MRSVFKGWKDKATGKFLGREFDMRIRIFLTSSTSRNSAPPRVSRSSERVYKAHEGAVVKQMLGIKKLVPQFDRA